MIRRLQTQLILLFISFALLVVVSIGVTYWGLQAEGQDALVVNLAGRQRMLIQQMTRLAFQWQDGDESAFAALQISEITFEQTLSALRNGGVAPYLTNSVVYLPITRDLQILFALNEVESAWREYRFTLDAMESPGGSASLQATLEEQSDSLVQKADEVVRLFEATATAKVNRLRVIQVAFFAGALILLTIGAWMTHRSLLNPLQELRVAAKRLGENQLDEPIHIDGPEEMRALSLAFVLVFWLDTCSRFRCRNPKSVSLPSPKQMVVS